MLQVLPRRTVCQNAFPRIGRRPVSEVNTADVLEILTPIWHVKAATAREVRQPCSSAGGCSWTIGPSTSPATVGEPPRGDTALAARAMVARRAAPPAVVAHHLHGPRNVSASAL